MLITLFNNVFVSMAQLTLRLLRTVTEVAKEDLKPKESNVEPAVLSFAPTSVVPRHLLYC